MLRLSRPEKKPSEESRRRRILLYRVTLGEPVTDGRARLKRSSSRSTTQMKSNPHEESFAALMVCSEADAGCPFVARGVTPALDAVSSTRNISTIALTKQRKSSASALR